MALFKTQAIVTRSLHYGESDKILTFFTRDFGKLKGIAKGARRSKKRFQNVLGLFSHLRLIFFDREGMGLVRVESGDLLHPFPKIREDLKKIYYGNYYLELVNEMAGEREASPEAFDLLLSFLFDLETVEAKEHFIYQEGQTVFKFAVSNMADIAAEIMQRNNLKSEDIAFLVPHQANLRIIDATGRRMGLPPEKVMVNIENYGNTTAATIPLCIWEYEKKLRKGDVLILAAFGGGFTWGSMYLRWAYDPK